MSSAWAQTGSWRSGSAAKPSEVSPHDRLRVVAALEEQMRQIASGVEPMPPKTTFQVEFGDIAEVVMQAATGLEVDLIAFGLKPPSTYVDRLPWMNAYKIVCEASCPVLSLHGAFARQ